YAGAGRLGGPTEELRQAMVGTLFTLTVVLMMAVAAPAYALSAWLGARWAVLGAVAVAVVVGALVVRRLPYPAAQLLRRTSRPGAAAVEGARQAMSNSDPGAESHIRV